MIASSTWARPTQYRTLCFRSDGPREWEREPQKAPSPRQSRPASGRGSRTQPFQHFLPCHGLGMSPKFATNFLTGRSIRWRHDRSSTGVLPEECRRKSISAEEVPQIGYAIVGMTVRTGVEIIKILVRCGDQHLPSGTQNATAFCNEPLCGGKVINCLEKNYHIERIIFERQLLGIQVAEVLSVRRSGPGQFRGSFPNSRRHDNCSPARPGTRTLACAAGHLQDIFP